MQKTALSHAIMQYAVNGTVLYDYSVNGTVLSNYAVNDTVLFDYALNDTVLSDNAIIGPVQYMYPCTTVLYCRCTV